MVNIYQSIYVAYLRVFINIIFKRSCDRSYSFPVVELVIHHFSKVVQKILCGACGKLFANEHIIQLLSEYFSWSFVKTAIQNITK